MPAIDALSCRTLVQEQLRGATFPSIIDGFVNSVAQEHSSLGTSAAVLLSAHKFNQTAFRGAMAVAETYYLSPEMHDICQEASQADDYPEDEVILREDPPSEAGFMYLPGRFRMIEMRGRLMIAHAVLWFNNRMWWLCDRRDPEDEMNLDMIATFGQKRFAAGPRYDMMSISEFNWGQPMPHILQFEKGVLPREANVRFTDQVDPKTGKMNRIMSTDHVINPQAPAPIQAQSPDLRFMLTVWRMMQQTLTSVTKEEVTNKGTRRYAEKAGIKDFGVNVIQLRRREVTGEIGTGQALSVRFPVRGHWRRIWCGPAENRYQRAVYVHPYIKGPENAPLIRRERINALVR